MPITGHIAPTHTIVKVIKIDRWHKRVLLETWLANSDAEPVQRWYKELDMHKQNIFFNVTT